MATAQAPLPTQLSRASGVWATVRELSYKEKQVIALAGHPRYPCNGFSWKPGSHDWGQVASLLGAELMEKVPDWTGAYRLTPYGRLVYVAWIWLGRFLMLTTKNT